MKMELAFLQFGFDILSGVNVMPFKRPVVRQAHHPERSRRAAIAAGAMLLFLGASSAFSQPVFAPPVNLGPKINSPFYDADPFLTTDGKKLFFVSTRDGNEDIWYSNWTDTGWTNAIKLGPQINFGTGIQHSPSISPDGQKLYYVDGDRGANLWDIWVSSWNSSTNDWDTPQNLGSPVNTPGVEFSAHLSPDGNRLYFFSDANVPEYRCGFFVSEWNGTSWSDPTELDPIIFNCLDQYPSVTSDGQWLYFDRVVSDGLSIFTSQWDGLNWGLAVDLRSQVGGRAGRPYITPNGRRLFFGGSIDLGGFGNGDVWVMEQKVPSQVPALQRLYLFFLIFGILIAGIFWIWKFQTTKFCAPLFPHRK